MAIVHPTGSDPGVLEQLASDLLRMADSPTDVTWQPAPRPDDHEGAHHGGHFVVPDYLYERYSGPADPLEVDTEELDDDELGPDVDEDGGEEPPPTGDEGPGAQDAASGTEGLESTPPAPVKAARPRKGRSTPAGSEVRF
jgi:hypothetical protein